jgi:outer membrane biosynthesis protein TonB
MRRMCFGAGVVAVMLACCSIQTLAQAPFKPAEVTSARDIPYPIQSIADGVVILDIYIDGTGAIARSTVLRDIPSLTSPAISSIQSWKFSPASRRGKPEQSVIRVAVVFRPRAYLAAGPAFEPILSEEDSNRADQRFIPPGIASVSYPQYPINAASPGTVVIQVTVGKSSAIQHLKVVRDLPPFTQFALSAVNKWRFQTATLDGKPVTSALVVAFVFAPLPPS